MCNFTNIGIENDPALQTPVILPENYTITKPAHCTISVQKTQCQPDISSQAALGAYNLHIDRQPFHQSVISAHTVNNTLYEDAQNRVKTWNETYTEENLKEKKLTLSWKTNISKVYYTDQYVDFSKIHFT